MNKTIQPLTAGSLDPHFGEAGVVNLNFVGQGAGVAQGLSFTPDESIYVAGTSEGFSYVLSRHDQEGDPDGTFGTYDTFVSQGMVIGDFATFDSSANAVQILPDGKLILKGYARTVSGDYPAAACFSASGVLDKSFGTNGYVIFAPPFAKLNWTGFESAPLDPAGKIPGVAPPSAMCKISTGTRILVSARIDSKTALVSLDTKGALDTGFAGTGYVLVERGEPGVWLDVVHTLSGKLLVAGSKTKPGETVPHPFLARYYGDGTLDKSFGNQGSITLDAVTGHFTDVVLMAGGKMVGVGYSVETSRAKALLMGRNQDGSPDPAFNNGNPIITSLDNAVSTWTSAAVASGGQMFVVTGGTYGAQSTSVVARFNRDGRPDTAFGTSGLVRLNLGTHTYSGCVLVQRDQKIVTCGTAVHSDAVFGYVARFLG